MSGFGGSKHGQTKYRRGPADDKGRRHQELVSPQAGTTKGTAGAKRLRRWVKAATRERVRAARIKGRQDAGRKYNASPAALAESANLRRMGHLDGRGRRR